jgi:hypothetical protein
MKWSDHGLVAVGSAVIALIAFTVIRAVQYDGVTLCFVVAAISGSWIGFFLWHRRMQSPPTAAATAQIGAAIALACLATGLGLHLAIRPFAYPDIQLSIPTVGSFIFPFVLRGTASKALAALKTKRS